MYDRKGMIETPVVLDEEALLDVAIEADIDDFELLPVRYVTLRYVTLRYVWWLRRVCWSPTKLFFRRLVSIICFYLFLLFL